MYDSVRGSDTISGQCEWNKGIKLIKNDCKTRSHNSFPSNKFL